MPKLFFNPFFLPVGFSENRLIYNGPETAGAEVTDAVAAQSANAIDASAEQAKEATPEIAPGVEVANEQGREEREILNASLLEQIESSAEQMRPKIKEAMEHATYDQLVQLREGSKAIVAGYEPGKRHYMKTGPEARDLFNGVLGLNENNFAVSVLAMQKAINQAPIATRVDEDAKYGRGSDKGLDDYVKHLLAELETKEAISQREENPVFTLDDIGYFESELAHTLSPEELSDLERIALELNEREQSTVPLNEILNAYRHGLPEDPQIATAEDEAWKPETLFTPEDREYFAAQLGYPAMTEETVAELMQIRDELEDSTQSVHPEQIVQEYKNRHLELS